MLKHTREINVPVQVDTDSAQLFRKVRADTHDELVRLYADDEILTASVNALDSRMDIAEEEIDSIENQFSGFTNQNSITVTYDVDTRKITLTGTFKAYYKMRLVPALTNGWISSAVPANQTAGIALYYDGTNYVWSNSFFPTTPAILIAYCYYRADGTFLFANRECHGMMPLDCHWEDHFSIGARKHSGGVLADYTAGSTTASLRRPTISQMVLADEDLWTTNAQWTGANYTVAVLQAAGTITSTEDQADIVPLSSARPYYNQYTGGAWAQTLMSNNQYMCVWVIAMPTTADAKSQKRRFFFLQGQSEGSLTTQQALTPNNVSLGGLSAIAKELVFIAKVIIQYTASDWKINSVYEISGTQQSQVIQATTADVRTGLQLTAGAARSTAGNVLFATVAYYNSSGYVAATGIWTCPEAGVYVIIFCGVNAATNTVQIRQNGNSIGTASNANGYGMTAACIAILAVDDTIVVYTYAAIAVGSYCSIFKISS